MNIAAIHILKKDLGLSDEKYRRVLDEVAGVTSSRFLCDSDARKVYRRLRAMGTAHQPATRYIWVLWGQLQTFLSPREQTGAWFCGFVRRAAGIALEDMTCLDLLDRREIHKVIEALKQRIAYESDRLSNEVPF